MRPYLGMIGTKFSGTCISDAFMGMHSSVKFSTDSSESVCQNDNGSSPSVKIMIVAWYNFKFKKFHHDPENIRLTHDKRSGLIHQNVNDRKKFLYVNPKVR